MLARLRRHPFAVEAFFRWSLVLAYALPARLLQPLLPRGLEVDTYDDQWGFLAIALVQTEDLRPTGMPRLFGRDFFLSGYRVFARFARPGQQALRGLKILRSDADRKAMVTLGNLFTHYGYRFAEIAVQRSDARLVVDVKTQAGEADLHIEADVATDLAAALPEGSPFRSLDDARKFAGPLPYTFDSDKDKMLVVRGVRAAWDPRPVRIVAHASSFLTRPELAQAGAPRLANAFFVENVPYAWKAGVLEELA